MNEHAMLSFDTERYLRIQGGAVGLAERIDTLVRDALASGATNLVFAGAGGAGILMEPAARLLRLGSTFPVGVERPAELVLEGGPGISRDTLVVIPSLSGTTAESIGALEHAQGRWCAGGHAHRARADSLGRQGRRQPRQLRRGRHVVRDASTSSRILDRPCRHGGTAASIDGPGRGRARAAAAARAAGGGQARLRAPAHASSPRRSRRESWHIFHRAGCVLAPGILYGMCILEEMQWIRTRPVHASDFFHGTLELVEAGRQPLAAQGRGRSRPAGGAGRELRPRPTDKVAVLDTAASSCRASPRGRAPSFPPWCSPTLLERVSAHLEVMRDHPLTTRRYYKRIAY